MEHDLQPSIPKSRPEAKEIHDVKGGQARGSAFPGKVSDPSRTVQNFLKKQ